MEITLHDNETVIINVKTPMGNSEYRLVVGGGRVLLSQTRARLELTEKEREIARTVGKIPGIKAYKERTSTSLLDAKNAVEAYLGKYCADKIPDTGFNSALPPYSAVVPVAKKTKLTEADRTRIRYCHVAGISQAALAREYGVHSKTIRRVLTKKA